MRWALALFAVLALFPGCPAQRLPTGLPPPEYEPPRVTPWPPPDAGAEAAPAELPLPDGGVSETGAGPGSMPADASVGEASSTR
jgi:hypothetical protein